MIAYPEDLPMSKDETSVTSGLFSLFFLISIVWVDNRVFTLCDMLCWFTSLNKTKRLTDACGDKPIKLKEYI